MSTCLDANVWFWSHLIGVVVTAVGLYLAWNDQASLKHELTSRRADATRRQLGPGMIRRMERNAAHALFAETMRLAALSCFLYVGVSTFLNTARVCSNNPLTWILIVGGVLVSLNSVHALWSRTGNNFAEGSTDEADEVRDSERDSIRDPGRDEGRDLVRDEARDDARDDARDKETT